MKALSMSKRLLLCLSDLSLASLYRVALGDDYEIEIADSQNECYAALRERPPVLLVLDHEMSWGSSEDILARLRSDSSLISIPVLLIAPGYMPADEVAQLQTRPIVATLQRPVVPEELVDILKLIENADATGEAV